MTTIPPVKYYRYGDRIHVSTQQMWMILTAHVQAHTTPSLPPIITYGELAARMGYQDKRGANTLSRQLSIIERFCDLNDLPMLNSIVVNKGTLVPGRLSTFSEGNKTVLEEQRSVATVNWFLVRPPTPSAFRLVRESMNSDRLD